MASLQRITSCVEHVKAAVKKLRVTNWLYADVEDSSIDDASRRVIECVSDTTSEMLVKASAEDVKSFQAIEDRLASTSSSEFDTLSMNSPTGITYCRLRLSRLYTPAASSRSSFCQRRKNTY